VRNVHWRFGIDPDGSVTRSAFQGTHASSASKTLGGSDKIVAFKTTFEDSPGLAPTTRLNALLNASSDS
jgi:hypothetical protein